MITKVIISKDVESKFNKELKLGSFSPEIRDLIEYWITEIEDLGYQEYVKSDLFKMLGDHSLTHSRQGQRAIGLDQKGARLIYKIVKDAIVIKVIKITANHDYNKGI